MGLVSLVGLRGCDWFCGFEGSCVMQALWFAWPHLLPSSARSQCSFKKNILATCFSQSLISGV